ncbi:MAG TPA: helix-turn-helix transcriptional regulator [Candidatus Pullilachnospira intestinigallinarum]|nr:helix-turn-helix transcriptional regulator [Candidatus Pullilachnospira intestinigallinarum]
MNIGEKIRTYRKAAGLTQEQVAGYLGVSAPAVHKWEKGSSCPDISLLPALARLLKTDLNELFSFREELTEWEINAFVRQLTDLGMNGDVEGAFSLAEEKIREYPHCHLLLYQAASVLSAVVMFSAEEKNQEHERQITRWLERAASGSTDKVRLSALYMLALRLMQKESYEEAEALLAQIPDGDIDKVLPMTAILSCRQDKDTAAVYLEGKILQAATRMQSYLYRLLELEEQTGNPGRADRIAEITENMVPLFGLWPYGAAVPKLLLAVGRKDAAECLRYLDLALSEAQKPWDMKKSPLYCRRPETPNAQEVGRRWSRALFAEIESSEEYDFLRRNEELRKIMETYAE